MNAGYLLLTQFLLGSLCDQVDVLGREKRKRLAVRHLVLDVDLCPYHHIENQHHFVTELELLLATQSMEDRLLVTFNSAGDIESGIIALKRHMPWYPPFGGHEVVKEAIDVGFEERKYLVLLLEFVSLIFPSCANLAESSRTSSRASPLPF
jgi:hypothetical protein